MAGIIQKMMRQIELPYFTQDSFKAQVSYIIRPYEEIARKYFRVPASDIKVKKG
jgi:hypothetical protein